MPSYRRTGAFRNYEVTILRETGQGPESNCVAVHRAGQCVSLRSIPLIIFAVFCKFISTHLRHGHLPDQVFRTRYFNFVKRNTVFLLTTAGSEHRVLYACPQHEAQTMMRALALAIHCTGSGNLISRFERWLTRRR